MRGAELGWIVSVCLWADGSPPCDGNACSKKNGSNIAVVVVVVVVDLFGVAGSGQGYVQVSRDSHWTMRGTQALHTNPS